MDSSSILLGSKPPHLTDFLSPPRPIGHTSPVSPLRLARRLTAAHHGGQLDEPVASPETAPPALHVSTSLVSCYAKTGRLDDARKVFDELPQRDLCAWTAMINGCAREERWGDVLVLLRRMMREGVAPDRLLLPRLLQACANTGDAATGRALHSIVVRTGALDDPSWAYTTNSLLAMYTKCGELAPARRLFEKIDKRDPATWNSMISGYRLHGKVAEAMELFDEMRAAGIEPSLVTWNTLISSLNGSGDPDRAMDLMKSMQQAGLVPDVFTWTGMISGLAQNKRTIQALGLFCEMRLADVEPNGITLACALSACASLKDLERGKEIHSLSVRMGNSDITLVGNVLIDFYAKCGPHVEDAERVFRRLPERDIFTWNSMIGCYVQSRYCGKAHELFSKMESTGVRRNVVSWNVMVSGYMQNGDEDQAMDLFRRMEAEGVERSTASWNLLIAGLLNNGNGNRALQVFRRMQFHCKKPNPITILSILPACANLVSARMVREIHACVLRRGLQLGLSISNSLIEMYAKSGDIRSARSLFDHLPSRDAITWNSLISGYLQHGHPEVALDLFRRMEQGEAKPNQATLASLISAYGMLGMVDEARKFFSSMEVHCGISPGQEHYAAMVGALGRSGRLPEAMDLIRKMPIRPDSATWSTLLAASRIYGNRSMANHAAEQLVELEPRNSIAQYLLMQTRALCKFIDVDKLATKLQKRWRGDKSPGYSWLAHLDQVFTFSTGDKFFTNSDLVYAKLDALEEEITAAEIFTVQNRYLEVEDEVSELVTGIHSEKLAIAFALLNPPVRGSIRIAKNRRTCLKCHTAAKYISSAYKCEILLKDPKCLHHFRDGICSCGDYW